MISSGPIKQRGGKRHGAGRKATKLSRVETPLKRVQAEQVLASIDELGAWTELLEATTVTSVIVIAGEEGQRENVTVPDYRVRADALKYLTNRRDGMPPQAVQHVGPDGKNPVVRVLIEHIGGTPNTSPA